MSSTVWYGPFCSSVRWFHTSQPSRTDLGDNSCNAGVHSRELSVYADISIVHINLVRAAQEGNVGVIDFGVGESRGSDDSSSNESLQHVSAGNRALSLHGDSASLRTQRKQTTLRNMTSLQETCNNSSLLIAHKRHSCTMNMFR